MSRVPGALRRCFARLSRLACITPDRGIGPGLPTLMLHRGRQIRETPFGLEADPWYKNILVARARARPRALGSDLIVVGPGHYSGISALLYSSVSRGVARFAPASVLLVHSEA
jgi:hypothetical protein